MPSCGRAGSGADPGRQEFLVIAPLAGDPAVQQVVSKAVAETVKADLNLEANVAEVFAGLDQLPLPRALRPGWQAWRDRSCLG